MLNKIHGQVNVSVIIPNYNGEILLKRNLPYLLAAKGNKKNKISEIIVVDDKSPDNSVMVLKNDFPQVKTIKLKVHRGFSCAVNTGVRSSKGNLIALINNDVVPKYDFLVSVFPHFENEDVFAVSLHEKGYGWAKATFKDGYIMISPGSETSTPHDTFWVSGGTGVFRKSQYIKLGGLDEALLSPFTWEDFDLCYRAVKRGLKLVWEPNANVVHEHESTTKLFSKKFYDITRERNQLLVTWKNLTSPNLIRKHLLGVFSRIIRHPGYLRVVLAAAWRLKLVLKRRKRELKETKVSDEAILARFT